MAAINVLRAEISQAVYRKQYPAVQYSVFVYHARLLCCLECLVEYGAQRRWRYAVNNVAYLAECGRARWKIENEHNNVLKNRGYNLEHNFGHGSNHAADIFFLLNLLAFQFHTILEYCDLEYQLAYSTFSVRVAFFESLRVLIRRRYFGSWTAFLKYVRGKDDAPL
jgi:hypothetical protein